MAGIGPGVHRVLLDGAEQTPRMVALFVLLRSVVVRPGSSFPGLDFWRSRMFDFYWGLVRGTTDWVLTMVDPLVRGNLGVRFSVADPDRRCRVRYSFLIGIPFLGGPDEAEGIAFWCCLFCLFCFFYVCCYEGCFLPLLGSKKRQN